MPSNQALDRITREQVTVILMGLYQLAQVEIDYARASFAFGAALFDTINTLIADNRLGRFAPPAAQGPRARQSTGDVIAAAERLHQCLANRPELAEQMQQYYDLVAAALAVTSPAVTAEPPILELDSARHLPHLRRVYIAAEEGQPDIILVGAPGEIHIPSEHPVLRRMAIRHRAGQIYPTLQLAHLSKTEQEWKPTGPKERLQKTKPRFDLTIYSYSGLPLAYVRTYFLDDSAIFIGRRLRVKLVTRPGERLLCTSISDLARTGDCAADQYGKELVRCVRVINAAA